MQEMFKKIMDNYSANKVMPFGSNKLAEYIRVGVKQIINDQANLNANQYLVEGSAGRGAWAIIPWIAIFDKEVTTTASKGYDIVYLFCEDMSGVYLSLNQGWTHYEKEYGVKAGLQEIDKVSSMWRSQLNIPDNYLSTKIDLKVLNSYSRSVLEKARGYELGHICGKFYDGANLPDSTTLIQDLRHMLLIYTQLKKQLLGPVRNSYLSLVDYKEGNGNTIENHDSSINGQLDLKTNTVQIKKNYLRDYSKTTDYIKKAVSTQKLGLAGEKLVIEYERKNLITNNRQDLADKVEHVAMTKGNYAGYDILSYTPEGKKKYIEVKTTSKKYQDDFYITENELNFAQSHKNEYYLYRIYNLKKHKGDLFIYSYNDFIKFKLIPKQFHVIFDVEDD